jgi:hypothetical protein
MAHPGIADHETAGHDGRGLLDRLMVLALQDAADRTFRGLAGRPVEEVTQALRAELRVAGLEAGEAPLPGAVRYAMVRAAEEIAAGDRPSILRRPAVPRGAGQRSTDR